MECTHDFCCDAVDNPGGLWTGKAAGKYYMKALRECCKCKAQQFGVQLPFYKEPNSYAIGE